MLVTLVDDSIPFNGMTPAHQPLGGAEKAFASLPAALARQGHVVRAVNRSPNSLSFDNVSWIHWDGRKPPITEVLIAFRKPALLEFTRATNARILWVTGPPDYLHRDPVKEMLDRTDAKLVFMGNVHTEAFKAGREETNTIYTRSIAPGVREEYRDIEAMDAADPPTAVVTTHPKHDLDWLLDLWVERIRPKAPTAELHVYSAAFKRAESGETISEDLKPIYGKALAGADHGVSIMAPSGDKDMARAYSQARVHLYPGSEREMYCSTLAESQAVGVPAVARPIGAVKERFIDQQSGFLAPDDDAFVENALAMLNDDEAFEKASGIARRGGRSRSWDTVAREFETALPMKILFITATRIGDAVLSTGLLAHLIERYPQARITVACGPAAAPLFAATPGVERVIEMEKQRGGGHWLALWRACVSSYWHLVVDLRASALAYLVPTRRRLIHRRDDGPIHRVQAIGALSGRNEPPSPRLWVTPEHEGAAARLAPANGTLLALGPGAGWRAKQWRGEHFAALARRLTAPHGIMPGATILVLGGRADRQSTRGLVEALPGCVDLVGDVDLLTTSALLSRCQLFIGNDSGLMHIAAASGVPTLGLFGPSREVHYAPWGRHTAIVRTTLSYDALIGAPGYDHRTADTLMDTLTVEMAEEGARALWAEAHGRAA